MGVGLNGYYQFSSKEDGLYITVYPPKDGGSAASIESVMEYIDKKKIECDFIKIKEIFKGSHNAVPVKISDNQILSYSEFGDYRISSDSMKVEVVFYPAFEGAVGLIYDTIISDLKKIGVTYGMDEAEINRFLTERDYGMIYTIVRGLEAEQGSEGTIEYNFKVELKAKPKMKEDGTVDFHSLENVNHIKAGDVVAVIEPELQGENGYDIYGRIIYPRKIKRTVFKYGKNLKVSENGLKLISNVSGHVTLEGDKVFVSNILDIVDVDNSTGDIDYDGNVNIKGNVLAGFSVKASGDVSVNGIVEGAVIIAGGNITLNRGVQGMNKAVLKSGRNIVSKFIESTESVTADGNIETDTILHSKVSAKGNVLARGKNGLIVGGEVRASYMIDAKTIGNAMGTVTVVGVGVDPAIKKSIDDLKKSIQTLTNNKMQMDQLLTALRKKQELGKLEPDKLQMLQKTMRNMILLEQDLLKQKNEYEEHRKLVSEDLNARIKVQKTAYVGTKVMFGEQYLFIKENCGFCQFVREGAEIKWKTL